MSAQTDECNGDIIVPQADGGSTRTPVEDCRNPFNADADEDVYFIPAAILNGVDIRSATTVSLAALPQDSTFSNIGVEGFWGNVALFRHEGADYRRVTRTTIQANSAADSSFNYTFTATGTYSLVLEADPPQLVARSWWEQIWHWVIPRSLAYYDSYQEVAVLTFTVALESSGGGEPPPAEPPAEDTEQCGDIIDPEGGRSPIEDCNLLFDATSTFPFALTLADTTIEADGTYGFPFAVDLPFRATSTNDTIDAPERVELYRHEGADYVVERRGDYTSVTTLQFTAAGTYTLVIDTEEFFSHRWLPRLDQLSDLVLPTAHAETDDPLRNSNRFAITFQVSEAPPTPSLTGTSSVLFLPGTQASRLYAGESIDLGFLDEVEQDERVWEPGNNDDVRALTMTDAGESVHDIYTDDVIDTINVQLGLGIELPQSDIYAGFLEFMASEAGRSIADFRVFPYDWRYDVFDVVDNGTQVGDAVVYPIETIEQMAQEHGGPVTLIGHSNGGLLAKAITARLQAADKTHLVDRIIFIGTPHLGTPKAVGTILHGYDQQQAGGFVVDDVVAREVINNLPGAYSLLPSERYQERVEEPLITFDQSETTAEFREYYGDVIDTSEQFVEFLTGAGGASLRVISDDSAINQPTTANTELLQQARARQATELTNWEAPSDIEAHYIVGTGLPTMKGITYRGLEEVICTTGVGCVPTAKVKPYAQFTRYGDETVVSESARGSIDTTNNLAYLNIAAIDFQGAESTRDLGHANLTESQYVQDAIARILVDQSATTVDFITDTKPTFSETYDIEVIDSPVRIYTEDTDGNRSGVVEEDGSLVVKQEIPGSDYFEFAGSKYLITPSDTDRTTTLIGEAEGSYTLTVAQLGADDTQETVSVLENASTTAQMMAAYEKRDGVFGTVTTDLDGDGEVDQETTLTGEVVAPPASYSALRAAITDAALSPWREATLLRRVERAEWYAERANERAMYVRVEQWALDSLGRIIGFYERLGYIDSDNAATIQEIIDNITDN